MKINPFIITGYLSAEYFCNREKETSQIISAIKNQRNITLFSFRRMGKTGLIHHVFEKLSNQKKISTFYFDIQDTINLTEFTKEFAKAVIGKFESTPTKILQNIGKTFASLRPSISYDSFSGEPKIRFEVNDENEAIESISQIFDYLKNQKKQILIAIDEFQQILNYPEKNIESLLRKHIQDAKNINFIFAGSHKHMLISMFKDHSRPFYQSTEMMHLENISVNSYKKFIIEKFKASKKSISDLDVDYILKWTKLHTFYVQFVCNRIYSLGQSKIDLEMIKKCMSDILEENRAVFHNYQNLLTTNQWNLLKAIGQEDCIAQVTSSYFINKYQLGTPSSVVSALKVLLDKEMIYKIDQNYCVNDLFLSRWLRQTINLYVFP